MLFLETCACLQCNGNSRIDARQQYIDKRMAIAKRTTITSVHTFKSLITKEIDKLVNAVNM
jgi:hypothetical protein